VATIPALRPKRLPCRTDTSAQCRVSEEDSRISVLTPGHRLGHGGAVRGPGVVGDDPDEEVGGEERAEDHHLGHDEKEHPERRRVYTRGAVRGRRSVVLAVGDRGGFHPGLLGGGRRYVLVDHVVDLLAAGPPDTLDQVRA